MRVRRTILALTLIPTLLLMPALAAGTAPASPGQQAAPATKASATVTSSPFGTLPDGTAVEAYTLTNASGIEVRVITYGTIVTSIKTPDKQGRIADIVLGHDRLEGYLPNPPYLGAVVGRYGNRIAKATFTLDGKTYSLAANDGANHLHGGRKGFDKVAWKAKSFKDARGAGVAFTRTSPDGEEGYPGNLTATITYTLTDRNELKVDYELTTDKATPQNLTQHTYFNLAADGSDILGHLMTIDAAQFTPVDATLIPTGQLATVEGTPLDFRKETAIGARIDAPHEQMKIGRGYDHNFVLVRQGPGLVKAAAVYDPKSGRTLEVATTEPGVQFYTGNFLDGSIAGKGGTVYRRRTGFCLETQHFPDSPNQSSFPTTILRPGETYRSQTVFTFGVRN
jgi:aldose 1-epimerase